MQGHPPSVGDVQDARLRPEVGRRITLPARWQARRRALRTPDCTLRCALGRSCSSAASPLVGGQEKTREPQSAARRSDARPARRAPRSTAPAEAGGRPRLARCTLRARADRLSTAGRSQAGLPLGEPSRKGRAGKSAGVPFLGENRGNRPLSHPASATGPVQATARPADRTSLPRRRTPSARSSPTTGRYHAASGPACGSGSRRSPRATSLSRASV